MNCWFRPWCLPHESSACIRHSTTAPDTADGVAVYSPPQIHYVVDKANDDKWKYSIGHVNKELVQQQLPPPGPDSLIMVCGPPPMMKAISGDKVSPKDQGELSGILKDAGYNKENVYKF